MKRGDALRGSVPVTLAPSTRPNGTRAARRSFLRSSSKEGARYLDEVREGTKTADGATDSSRLLAVLHQLVQSVRVVVEWTGALPVTPGGKHDQPIFRGADWLTDRKMIERRQETRRFLEVFRKVFGAARTVIRSQMEDLSAALGELVDGRVSPEGRSLFVVSEQFRGAVAPGRHGMGGSEGTGDIGHAPEVLAE